MAMQSSISRCRRGDAGGFTLVEVLVASTILLVVVLVLLQMSLGMTKLWQSTSGTVSDYQSARLAFTTINRILARATLRTYIDYIDTTSNSPFGIVRTTSNASTFTISSTTPVARASELHFVSGPTTKLLGQTAKASLYPGDAIFFQAPLGYTNTAADKVLNSAMNSVGFYVQYGTPLNLPTWMNSIFGATTNRFRLIEAIQPTENMNLYTLTSLGTSNALKWLPFTAGSTSSTESTTSYTTSVLAENVLLLLVRPRLDPQNEQAVATMLGKTYNATIQNSLISPDYNYDSRAWETGYTGPVSRTGTTSLAQLMRNQLPPIVDVVMICTDNSSLARFKNPATPPTEVQVPATLFVNSAKLDADLATYGQQLTAAHIRFRTFRSTVNMQSASWINH